MLEVLRRELRRISPGVKIETEEVSNILLTEVLKRDILEGDKGEEAKKKIQTFYRKIAKEREKATKVSSPVKDTPMSS